MGYSEKSRLNAYSRGYIDNIEGDGPMEGQCLSCCMMFWAVLVFIFSLCMTMNVTYWYGSFCYYNYMFWPYQRQCFADNYMTTSPCTVDALPYGGNSSGAVNGNGTPDNWSLLVAAVCGSVGSIFVCVCMAPASVRRGGPAFAAGASSIIGLALHLATIGCLIYNLFIPYTGYQFNPFYEDAYVWKENTSVAYYWVMNHYYNWFGSMVYMELTFVCILCFFELLLFCVAICASDDDFVEKSTGLKRQYKSYGDAYY
jgi:hypothetical protein